MVSSLKKVWFRCRDAEVLEQPLVPLAELLSRLLRVGAAAQLGEHTAEPGFRLGDAHQRHAAQVVLEVAADLRGEEEELLPGERAHDPVGGEVALSLELDDARLGLRPERAVDDESDEVRR
jgi:hypothetical protein